MFLNFGVILNALLVVGGVLWCREMFGRWNKDLAEFRGSKDPSTRWAIGLLWALTAVIALLLLNWAIWIVRSIGALF